MRTKRIILFFIMIAAGLGLGLLYGWIINPLRVGDTSGDLLRSDYKADYVLMVAEIYAADGKLDQAVERLSLLGDRPPVQVVGEGLVTASTLGYVAEDIELMNRLAEALIAQPATTGPGETP